METLEKKNKKSLDWWMSNFANANDFSEYKIGDEIKVSIFDVMPNLRCYHLKSGCEFEINNSRSTTNGPIDVIVDDSQGGLIVIDDGHHRFNEAILSGQTTVSVKIVSKEKCDMTLIKKLKIKI